MLNCNVIMIPWTNKLYCATGNSKELYNIVRQLSGKPPVAPIYPVPDANGKIATTPDDIAKVYMQNFSVVNSASEIWIHPT